jgi:hypothetical protein
MDSLLAALPPQFSSPLRRGDGDEKILCSISALLQESVVLAAVPAVPTPAMSQRLHSCARVPLSILSWLDAPELCTVSKVNRCWNVLSGVDDLWKPLAKAKFPELLHRSDDSEWRDCYKRKREVVLQRFKHVSKGWMTLIAVQVLSPRLCLET